jgi:hypothetical protein
VYHTTCRFFLDNDPDGNYHDSGDDDNSDHDSEEEGEGEGHDSEKEWKDDDHLTVCLGFRV